MEKVLGVSRVEGHQHKDYVSQLPLQLCTGVSKF